MTKLKVRKVGNSLRVTLPIQVARALHVGEGDVLRLTEVPDAAGAFLERYKNALRDLAT